MAITAPARRRWLRWGAELLLVAAIFVAVSAWQKRHMVEGPAPTLTGPRLDGAAFDLRALRGQAVVVHFWAGWCPICRLEEGSMAALAADHASQVITVAMQSGEENEVRALLRERGLLLPVIADPQGRIAAQWGVNGVPATFVVDGAGHIRFREMGYTSGPGLRLRLWWAGHL
jgi:peroxiredoxin